VLLGRSPDCPFSRRSRRGRAQRQIEIKDEILKPAGKWKRTPRVPSLGNRRAASGCRPAATTSCRSTSPTGSQDLWHCRNAVRSGDVVLDCGANVGVYTRDALDSGAKLVVAIEPAPENIECLRRNFAPEVAAGRVIVYPKGVWDKDDFLTLNVDPNNSAADSFLIQRKGRMGS